MPIIQLPDFSFISVAPQCVILTTALVVLLIDLFVKQVERINLTLTALLGVVIAFIFSQNLAPSIEPDFSGMILRDPLGIYLDQLLLVGTGLVILLCHTYAIYHPVSYGELIVLLLFATLGMMVISISADLIMIFIGIELLSICLYILTGMDKSSLASGEASLKYFLLGAFATGFLVYGAAFVFGLYHTTNLIAIGQVVASSQTVSPMLIFGFAMVLVGLGFKTSLVPFHMWAPDVYQGAPTPITSWIATGSKIAGFVALVRIFSMPSISFEPLGYIWVNGLWLLCLLTMIVGNAGALMQNNIKRMLAYSSIAHGGYLIMAFVAHGRVSDTSNLGLHSLLFYLAAYLFMTIGSFGIVLSVRKNGQECNHISDYAGFAKQYPLFAGLMSVFLFSLAGMPFTIGFWGKLWLFGSAIQAEYIWLAVVGIVTTLLSFYYYLRVIVFMYMREPDESQPFEPISISSAVAVSVSAATVVFFGIFPNTLWKVVSACTSSV